MSDTLFSKASSSESRFWSVFSVLEIGGVSSTLLGLAKLFQFFWNEHVAKGGRKIGISGLLLEGFRWFVQRSRVTFSEEKRTASVSSS